MRLSEGENLTTPAMDNVGPSGDRLAFLRRGSIEVSKGRSLGLLPRWDLILEAAIMPQDWYSSEGRLFLRFALEKVSIGTGGLDRRVCGAR